MSAADPTTAVAGYLLAQVGSLVEGRVFRPRLPDTEEANMPRACLVVMPAGGYARFGGATLAVGDPRVDVLAYGSTELEAQNVAREALLALKRLRQHVVEGCRLYSARVSGVVPLIDPDTAWPYTMVTAQVMCADTAVV